MRGRARRAVADGGCGRLRPSPGLPQRCHDGAAGAARNRQAHGRDRRQRLGGDRQGRTPFSQDPHLAPRCRPCGARRHRLPRHPSRSADHPSRRDPRRRAALFLDDPRLQGRRAMVSRPAVVVVARSSLPLAATIADRLDGEVVEGAASLVSAFLARRPVIGICAAGIIIRKLAPHLGDKAEDPPVVAVADNGSVVVPLLGGHHGANALARTIAELSGGTAAITTASDARLGVALDDPPSGWSLANPEHHKSFAAAWLDGATVRLLGEAPWLATLPHDPQGSLAIRITEAIAIGSSSELVFVPRTLAVGVGCERGTSAEELIGLVT